ncbi:MAG: ABC transporter permease [Promethearchaeota archaeon]|nr:MAG: ABC transporter permease [Candidatus Lokiarchaeota archaeon]
MAQNMIKYIIKRILLMIPMLFILLIMTWILSRLMSIDPAANMFDPFTTDQAAVDAMRRKLGLDQPWFIQLAIYIKNFFLGDLGQSYLGRSQGYQVTEYLGLIIPRTVELMIVPTILAPIIAVKLGVTSAAKKDKPADTIIRGIAVAGSALPSFLIGMLLMYFGSVILPALTGGELFIPTIGNKDPTFDDPTPFTNFRIIDCILSNRPDLLLDTLIHLILPWLTLTIVSLAGITRVTRSTMLDVLQEDYVRTARAKGCSESSVISKHALRNAMIPTSTVIVAGFRNALIGSVIVERIFNYIGLGFTTWEAILYSDYWMILGIILYFGIIVLASNLISDVLYTIIDPRIIYK